MFKDIIFLSEALKTMSTPDNQGRAVPFSISFRTLQRNSKTGGRLVTYNKAKLVMKEDFNNNNTVESLRKKPSQQPGPAKKPNHWQNKTRNIKVLPSGDIKKIHINHIIEINNKAVVY